MPVDRPLSYWMTLARLGFEEDLARLMNKKKILKSDLAKGASVSPPFITKVLGGTNNYTLKTMAKLARAVGAVLEVRLADEQGEVVRVLDVATASKIGAPAAARSPLGSSVGQNVADFKEYAARRAGTGRVEIGATAHGITIPQFEEAHG
jgi:hypothetical protein